MENNFNTYLELKDNPFSSQLKMFFHSDRIAQYILSGDTFPIFMELNLTDVCNLKCKWCISDNRIGVNELKIYPFLKFIEDFKRLGGKAVTFSGGGEPTLYHYFKEVVNKCKEVGLEIGLMTNGVFNEKLIPIIGNNFKWIRISLDFIDKKKYKKYKGIDAVDIVRKNIKLLKKFPMKLGINCNIGKETTIKDIKDILLLKNACSYIQFRPVLPRFFKNEKIEINNRVWNFVKKINDRKINLSLDKFKNLNQKSLFSFSTCDGHFFEPILNANGDVKVCMYHPDDENFTFGNIYENNLEDIWKSIKRKKSIDFVRKLNYFKYCQVCCKLCEINKVLEFIKNPKDEMDINFL